MKKSITKFFILLVIPLTFWGCLEEIADLDQIQDYTWNPNLALPIANSSFGLTEFLENDSIDQYVDTDENGLIVFSYQEQFQSQDAASYVEIPDETFSESMAFDAPILIQLPIEFTVNKTESFTIMLENAEGDEIDSVLLSSGSLELDIQANFPASGEVSFTFNSALDNGQPLTRTYPWTYTGQQPALDITDIIDVSNIKFDLTEGGTTFNTFQFDVEITLNYEGEPVLPTNSLDINVKLLDQEFEAAYGLIAARSISSDAETVQFAFFENILDGSFYLDAPKITLGFNNSFGIPIGVNLNNLTASNSTQTQNLTGSITTSQQIIGAPDITQVGESVYTEIVIDNTNSNLPDIISLLPTEITFQLDGTINPDGLTDRSFVLSESAVDIDLNAELPLIGNASNLRIEQDFEVDGADVFDNINYALIQISVENEFPLGTLMQLYFNDEFGQTLDVLISSEDQRVIAAAQVDSDGFITGTTTKVTEIELPKSKIDLIKDTKTIKLEASFNTTENGSVSVKILDSYKLRIKIGVQTEFNIPLEF